MGRYRVQSHSVGCNCCKSKNCSVEKAFFSFFILFFFKKKSDFKLPLCWSDRARSSRLCGVYPVRRYLLPSLALELVHDEGAGEK